jgi:hypothetical protein
MENRSLESLKTEMSLEDMRLEELFYLYKITTESIADDIKKIKEILFKD